nr:DUF4294 domain-containing protein [uncultured Capnocytophaga sp.]
MSRYIVPNLLFFILYIIPLSYPSLQAQTRDTIYVFDQQFYSGDTIQLSEINLFAKERTFTDLEAQKRYLLLRNRVKRVYPYAKMAADRLYAMKHTMDTMHNNKQKRIYVKRTQKYLEEHFTDELKKLSRSQGRILIKLIHRQTGQIAYDLVKNMRNGWTAFWYNNTAWLYDLSLKKGYDPVNIEEDYWIEEIILRAINTGEIEYQTPALRFNFSELSEQRQKRLAN